MRSFPTSMLSRSKNEIGLDLEDLAKPADDLQAHVGHAPLRRRLVACKPQYDTAEEIGDGMFKYPIAAESKATLSGRRANIRTTQNLNYSLSKTFSCAFVYDVAIVRR